MTSTTRRITTAGCLAVATAFTVASPAHADPDPQRAYQLRDGVTAPVYSYERAIRETVTVIAPDGDGNGVPDHVSVDIVRPREPADHGRTVPAILEVSPYYLNFGRGNEAETKTFAPDGSPRKIPLWYDNYFVPRGYAFVAADLPGTGRSTGCADSGGDSDIGAAVAVVNWLTGSGKAVDAEGRPVRADWSSGDVGMVGKSWDGAIVNGAAATGVPGLRTIVPQSGISAWYRTYRFNGVSFSQGQGAAWLADQVTQDRTEQVDCTAVHEAMRVASDVESGEYNEFWSERDYLAAPVPDASRVRASVFLTHGLNDRNTKLSQVNTWWRELAEHDVPRRIWLSRVGHVDPFDFRRAEWVSTLHRWMDRWLLGIRNGIMREPVASIEREPDHWVDQRTWPAPYSFPTRLSFAPAGDRPGTLRLWPALPWQRQSFTDAPGTSPETLYAHPTQPRSDRLAFLTDPLDRAVHISGTPRVTVRVRSDQPVAYLSAFLVDYGTDRRINVVPFRSPGIRTLDTESCWGASTSYDDSCYRDTEKVTAVTDLKEISVSLADVSSPRAGGPGTPLEPGHEYTVRFDLLPHDYVVEPGHRLGLVIAGSMSQSAPVPPTLDVRLAGSTLTLPVVGGPLAWWLATH